jgi:hypothetical protein
MAAGAGSNLQRLQDRGLGRRNEEPSGLANESVRAMIGDYCPRKRSKLDLSSGGNTKAGQRDSGRLAVFILVRDCQPDKTGAKVGVRMETKL